MLEVLVINISLILSAYYLHSTNCLLYTSGAADEEDSVDLGGRRIIKKKEKKDKTNTSHSRK